MQQTHVLLVQTCASFHISLELGRSQQHRNVRVAQSGGESQWPRQELCLFDCSAQPAPGMFWFIYSRCFSVIFGRNFCKFKYVLFQVLLHSKAATCGWEACASQVRPCSAKTRSIQRNKEEVNYFVDRARSDFNTARKQFFTDGFGWWIQIFFLRKKGQNNVQFQGDRTVTLGGFNLFGVTVSELLREHRLRIKLLAYYSVVSGAADRLLSMGVCDCISSPGYTPDCLGFFIAILFHSRRVDFRSCSCVLWMTWYRCQCSLNQGVLWSTTSNGGNVFFCTFWGIYTRMNKTLNNYARMMWCCASSVCRIQHICLWKHELRKNMKNYKGRNTKKTLARVCQSGRPRSI